MKTTDSLLRHAVPSLIFCCVAALGVNGISNLHQTAQPPEVIEAYQVCEKFQRLLGENLDFDGAYEATFPRNLARRRAIAIADGEFGNLNFAEISSELLIKAYKLRMQTFYLMLPLASPGQDEEKLFFPENVKEVLERKPPPDAQKFRAYVSQLKRDVDRFRLHLQRLMASSASVAERVSKFKAEMRAARFESPPNKVEPIRGYYRSSVLRSDEPYYEINGYSVARDQGKMRIVGIRFFNRLF